MYLRYKSFHRQNSSNILPSKFFWAALYPTATPCVGCTCIHEAPWSVANRLHGQRTGDFLWRPMLRLFQEDQPIPARPYPELRTWMAVWSGVISVSPHTQEMLQHLSTGDQPPWHCHTCIPSTTSILAPTQPAIGMTSYTHALTVTKSSAFHSQL